jgi:uncharacterized protein (DUF2384 family)
VNGSPCGHEDLNATDTLESLAALALGRDEAREWFAKPNRALGGEPPLRLLGTTEGRKRVENLITALLNGSFV